MKNKELRKELEIELLKTIEVKLSSKNVNVAKAMRKQVGEASKQLAKKYYKTLKAQSLKKGKSISKKVTSTAPKKKTTLKRK